MNTDHRDPVIGLDVGGRTFFCHRSTLTSAKNSYFAARFGEDSHFPPGDSYKDERGRDVYFIDREGHLFEFVLRYLRTRALKGLPPFHKSPELWRELREEADFYALEGMAGLLYVSYSCSPANGDRGILHWLGLNRGTSTEYRNPYVLGLVDVRPFWEGSEELGYFNEGADPEDLPSPYDPRSKCATVQYRPETLFTRDGAQVFSRFTSCICWCMELPRARTKTVVIDLRDLLVRPTHYSLRYGECNGMNGEWAFDASVDGQEWNTLHEADQTCYLTSVLIDEYDSVRADMEDRDDRRLSDMERIDYMTSHMEQKHRGTWPCSMDESDDTFYRFLRIRKVGRDGCLHGTGLELFGDVHEA